MSIPYPSIDKKTIKLYKDLTDKNAELNSCIIKEKKKMKQIHKKIEELNKHIMDEFKSKSVSLSDKLTEVDDNVYKDYVEQLKLFLDTHFNEIRKKILVFKKEKDDLFKKIRKNQLEQKQNKTVMLKLLQESNIYNKIFEYSEYMFKKWGGHQETMNCIVCNEYGLIPYKIKTPCECVYNICKICGRQHFLSCQKDQSDPKDNPKCVLCSSACITIKL